MGAQIQCSACGPSCGCGCEGCPGRNEISNLGVRPVLEKSDVVLPDEGMMELNSPVSPQSSSSLERARSSVESTQSYQKSDKSDYLPADDTDAGLGDETDSPKAAGFMVQDEPPKVAEAPANILKLLEDVSLEKDIALVVEDVSQVGDLARIEEEVSATDRESGEEGTKRLSWMPTRQSPEALEADARMRRECSKQVLRARAVARIFPERKKNSKLSMATWVHMEKLFKIIDADGNYRISPEEAVAFIRQGRYPNVGMAIEIFHQIDTNRSGYITPDEFIAYWKSFVELPNDEMIPDGALREGIKEIIATHSWIDWERRRKTIHVSAHLDWPKRPFFSTLSRKTWNMMHELFLRIDADESGMLTIDEAKEFFMENFKIMQVEKLFKVADDDGDGVISGDEFVRFWMHIKKNGYSESQIQGELSKVLEGDSWSMWRRNSRVSQKRRSRVSTVPLVDRDNADCGDDADAG